MLIFFNFFCIIIVEKHFRYYLYNEKQELWTTMSPVP